MMTIARSDGAVARIRACAALLTALLLLAALPAAAQQTAGDVVIAEVDGVKIYRSDFDDEVNRLPPQYRNLPMPFLYPALLDRLIDRKLLANAARARGLASDPDFQARMRRAEERALQEVFLLQLIEGMEEDADLERYYQSLNEKSGGEAVLTLRQIVVREEALAAQIVRDLERGVAFAELASAHSIDETAARGGLIGDVRRGDMAPRFEQAAFALQAGQFTATPVHSPSGWHIIYLEKRSDDTSPEELTRLQFQAERAAAKIDNAVDTLRGDAAIRRYNYDGTPIVVPKPGGG